VANRFFFLQDIELRTLRHNSFYFLAWLYCSWTATILNSKIKSQKLTISTIKSQNSSTAWWQTLCIAI